MLGKDLKMLKIVLLLTATLSQVTAAPLCPLCPPGQGPSGPCDDFLDTKCINCPAGTYSSQIDDTHCILCSMCGPDLYKLHPCNATSDVVCELCSWPESPKDNVDYQLKCVDESESENRNRQFFSFSWRSVRRPGQPDLPPLPSDSDDYVAGKRVAPVVDFSFLTKTDPENTPANSNTSLDEGSRGVNSNASVSHKVNQTSDLSDLEDSNLPRAEPLIGKPPKNEADEFPVQDWNLKLDDPEKIVPNNQEKKNIPPLKDEDDIPVQPEDGNLKPDDPEKIVPNNHEKENTPPLEQKPDDIEKDPQEKDAPTENNKDVGSDNNEKEDNVSPEKKNDKDTSKPNKETQDVAPPDKEKLQADRPIKEYDKKDQQADAPVKDNPENDGNKLGLKEEKDDNYEENPPADSPIEDGTGVRPVDKPVGDNSKPNDRGDNPDLSDTKQTNSSSGGNGKESGHDISFPKDGTADIPGDDDKGNENPMKEQNPEVPDVDKIQQNQTSDHDLERHPSNLNASKEVSLVDVPRQNSTENPNGQDSRKESGLPPDINVSGNDTEDKRRSPEDHDPKQNKLQKSDDTEVAETKESAELIWDSVSPLALAMTIITSGFLFFFIGFFYRRSGSHYRQDPFAEQPQKIPEVKVVRPIPINRRLTSTPPPIVKVTTDEDEDEEEELENVFLLQNIEVDEDHLVKQSPIDIVTQDVQVDDSLNRIPLQYYYVPENSQYIVNTGSTIELSVDYHESRLTGGPLGNCNFRLDHIDFHWGDTIDRGSEHSVDGRKFPAECHFIHWNEELYQSFKEATQFEDGLAIIVVFLQVDGKMMSDHLGLHVVTRCLSDLCFKGQKVPILGGFDPTTLFPENQEEFWTYEGSVTTPPYYENVTWIIFRRPINISNLQIERFRQLNRHRERNPNQQRLVNNYRSIQPLGDRLVRGNFNPE